MSDHNIEIEQFNISDGTEKSLQIMRSYSNSSNNGAFCIPIKAGVQYKVDFSVADTSANASMRFFPENQ